MNGKKDNEKKNKKSIGIQLLYALGFLAIAGVILLVFFFMAISE